MNDFDIMCKKLDKAKTCGCQLCTTDNEYIFAYNAVKKYVNDDINKLYKLKGESEESNFFNFRSQMVAIFTMVVTVFALFFSIVSFDIGKASILTSVFGIILLVATVYFFYYILFALKKYRSTAVWGGYLKVAIDVIEEELKNR